MSWTGARPRKIALNINFSKATNREGSKLILQKKINKNIDSLINSTDQLVAVPEEKKK